MSTINLGIELGMIQFTTHCHSSKVMNDLIWYIRLWPLSEGGTQSNMSPTILTSKMVNTPNKLCGFVILCLHGFVQNHVVHVLNVLCRTKKIVMFYRSKVWPTILTWEKINSLTSFVHACHFVPCMVLCRIAQFMLWCCAKNQKKLKYCESLWALNPPP